MAIVEALHAGLPIEDADAAISAPMRIPASGAFGLLDLIGVDLVPHVWGSLHRQLPASDLLQSYDLTAHPLIQRMIQAKRLGRKTGAGFYRKSRSGRAREILDPATFEYRAERPSELRLPKSKDLRQFCESDEAAGRLAWRVLSRTVVYASSAAPEIADTVADIDLGMSLGYNWIVGPFQLADSVGARWVAERLARGGEAIPPLLAKAAEAGSFYTVDGSPLATAPPYARSKSPKVVKPLAALKGRTVFENDGAILADIGDGVLCLEHKTKMAIYDNNVFAAIGVALEEVPKAFRALIIGSDHPRAFSCGADLSFFLGRIKAGDFAGLDAFLRNGQDRFMSLKYAPFPVVAAAFCFALGGGCETLLHMHAIAAHAELNAGMPESNLGLLPCWGGCTQMAVRWRKKGGVMQGPVAWLADPFALILGSRVSGSALEARDFGILRESDAIVMDRARVIGKAKTTAIQMAEAGFTPPERETLFLPGPSGKASLMSGAHSQHALGRMSANDLAVAEALATILSGGATDPLRPMTEHDVLSLERETVVELARRPATEERIAHMLATGKPLRN
jgi:3-hydroxyacyl-CoA dehydrogenase